MQYSDVLCVRNLLAYILKWLFLPLLRDWGFEIFISCSEYVSFELISVCSVYLHYLFMREKVKGRRKKLVLIDCCEGKI